VDTPTGSAEKPMSLDQIIEKYRNCAKSAVDENRIQESINKVLNFEKLTNVSELIHLLVKK
jgi:2-methylcitrate dehydratase PrpD